MAGYVGQTATKTMDKIGQANGGILFVDEAYALTSHSDSDFGKEAIETLLKQMEDKRGQFAVIVAGYTDNMATFLSSNPGLASRFDVTIKFEDYNVEELTEIGVALLKNEGLTADDEAIAHLKKYFDYLYGKRDKFFGNARSIRKVILQAIKNQNLRMASITKAERTPEVISVLILADVKEFDENLDTSSSQSRIGFKVGS